MNLGSLNPKSVLAGVLPLPATLQIIKRRPWMARRVSREITTAFHLLYHSNYRTTWRNTYWLGVPVQRVPLDLWIYQEILFEVQPDVIVETGTRDGGSAYFFASMCDLLKRGRVITIDVEEVPGRPRHDRITYLHGSSTAEEIVKTVKGSIKPSDKVLVTLDSDHAKHHVLEELRIYSKMASVGSYVVVDDTNLNGHPVNRPFGPGPAEAVEEFLAQESGLVRDTSREKFGLTFSPGGFLKRVH
ncbi:MAG: CmcI family methyltransferase [Bryobacteraceae bacterium]|jgi:cephalosporin hydroxylase